MDSLVTIVLPAYNAEKHIGEAVDSILRQTEKRFKLWIVDDNSSDSTYSAIKQFTKDPRVKVFKNSENIGLARLLNHYHKMVETPYIARMDSDDIMFPSRLERQLQVISLFSQIDVLGTRVVAFQLHLPKFYEKPTGEVLRKVKSLPHPTILGRSQWFKDNPYNETLRRNEDAELWMRCSSSNLFLINEPLLYYREDPSIYLGKYVKGYKDAVKIFLLHKTLRSAVFLYRYSCATIAYFVFSSFSSSLILLKRRRR